MTHIKKITLACIFIITSCFYASDSPWTDSERSMSPITMYEVFTPRLSYIKENPEYVGHYYIHTHIATIHDPQSDPKEGYVFVNVFPIPSNNDVKNDQIGQEFLGFYSSKHGGVAHAFLFGDLEQYTYAK